MSAEQTRPGRWATITTLGTWTAQDWATFSDVKTTLGDLLREVGHPQDAASIYDLYGPIIIRAANIEYELQGDWIPGPDGTSIRRGAVPTTAIAVTTGNTITLRRDLHLSRRRARALLAHEYTHVLQYRRVGWTFWGRYFVEGLNNWETNSFEVPAVHIERIYSDPSNDWLPPPWELGDVAP